MNLLMAIIGRIIAFLPKVDDRSKSRAYAKDNIFKFGQLESRVHLLSPNLAGDATITPHWGALSENLIRSV